MRPAGCTGYEQGVDSMSLEAGRREAYIPAVKLTDMTVSSLLQVRETAEVLEG